MGREVEFEDHKLRTEISSPDLEGRRSLDKVSQFEVQQPSPTTCIELTSAGRTDPEQVRTGLPIFDEDMTAI